MDGDSGTLLWGAIGAAAPEIVRWYRISRSETPGEWRRFSYWIATAAYVGLGALMALLIAQPNPYASFLTGLTTEFAVLGALNASGNTPPGHKVEEISTRPATPIRATLVALRCHATYLTADA